MRYSSMKIFRNVRLPPSHTIDIYDNVVAALQYTNCSPHSPRSLLPKTARLEDEDIRTSCHIAQRSVTETKTGGLPEGQTRPRLLGSSFA